VDGCIWLLVVHVSLPLTKVGGPRKVRLWNVMVIESYFGFLIIGRGSNRGIRILVCLITSRALSEPTVSPVRGQEFAADRLVSSIDILETK
jgi:hypothetical protein